MGPEQPALQNSGLTEALGQPTHFGVPLHGTTGSISPSAQGLGPNMCPSPGQMHMARAVLLPRPGITCSPAASLAGSSFYPGPHSRC